MLNLRMTYDSTVDAAYIYLSGCSHESAGPVHTYEMTAPEEVDSFVALDWQNGRIVGLEVLDASERLHPDLLASAEQL